MGGINPPSPPAPSPSPPRVGDKRGRAAIDLNVLPPKSNDENPDEEQSEIPDEEQSEIPEEPQSEIPNDPKGEKPNEPKDPKADVSIIGLKDHSPDFLLAFKEECHVVEDVLLQFQLHVFDEPLLLLHRHHQQLGHVVEELLLLLHRHQQQLGRVIEELLLLLYRHHQQLGQMVVLHGVLP
ncbi:hypothetical protein Droror1_Dr00022376 [Drosera rotundifolia]